MCRLYGWVFWTLNSQNMGLFRHIFLEYEHVSLKFAKKIFKMGSFLPKYIIKVGTKSRFGN